MGYPKDLDEYTTTELYAELERRADADKHGLCDYCRRPAHTPPCKFPDRHNRQEQK